MLISRSHKRLVLGALAVDLIIGLAAVWWLCARSPKIAFLPPHGPAEWVVYPKPADGGGHGVVEFNTVFRRSFSLDQVPAQARVTVRALKRFALAINGVPAGGSGVAKLNWKDPTQVEIAGMLRPGTNEISVTVFNSNGPPALWLTLEASGFRLNSGPDWESSLEGAAWRNARPASQPMSVERGNLLFSPEHPAGSFLHQLPLLALFAALSAVMLLGGSWWLKRYQARGEPDGPIHSAKFAAVPVAVMAILWIVLFVNNHGQLPDLMGFDVVAHLEYIDYIRTHHALPLATEGWEMCQPPLYYMISAAIASPLKATTYGPEVIGLCRIFGLLFSIAHFTLIFLSARLLFPRQFGKQLFALILAACLPEHIYLSQYVTNESFTAACVTGALYFCLRILTQDRDSWRLPAAAGFCLGLGLLSKITAIFAVPFIGGALFGWLVLKRPGDGRAWVRTLGVTMVTAFAVCGWHYLRVWKHFGTPVVNDWDAASRFAWWTDEGCHTVSYFSRFGECLVSPFYSVFHGFADGIYSTLWGDGLYGGWVNLDYRPPWNYELMATGFLLALLPTALILTGTAACLRKFVRRPEPVWFLLLGLASTTCAALVYMNLKLPFYCNVKAFYALITLLPMCAFGAIGWDILSRQLRLFRIVLCIAFGTWALNAYASFWIRTGAPATHVTRGLHLAAQGFHENGVREFQTALQLDPHDVTARTALAVELFAEKRTDEARQQIELALEDGPDNANAHLQLATILGSLGNLESAVRHAAKAVELAPDMAFGYHKLCLWLQQLNRNPEAVTAGREGLRIEPANARLQYLVGSALAAQADHLAAIKHFGFACDLKPGEAATHDQLGLSLAALNRWGEAQRSFARSASLTPGEATFHFHLALAFEYQGDASAAIRAYRQALRLKPELLPAIEQLAWLLATHPNPELRNGAEAVGLAERACRLPNGQTPMCLRTLAAAYAEAGRFDEAVVAAGKSMELAKNSGDQGFLTANQKLLKLYQAKTAYHQEKSGTGAGSL
ncbi:MAG: Photosystem assembly protein Ycf3 [Pedosphaera sp.]|nr:Photosystem assembly protein Ycf3 [Pedosphaera sp.]